MSASAGTAADAVPLQGLSGFGVLLKHLRGRSQRRVEMRAQKRRKERMRKMTIIATVLIIAVSLGVGVYFLSTSGQSSSIDRYIGQPVSSADMAAIVKVSGQPYGPPPSTAMQGVLQKYSGTPLVSGGKPTVVFVGGDFCPYCAIERWALVVALARFGTFTGLQYMTSAPRDVGTGDFATFTFIGSSYTSQYVAFRPYEAYDRSRNALQTVPANYSAVWSAKAGGGVPFLDFGNAYLLTSSVPSDPTTLTGKNWTAILTDISTSDSTGVQIREAANLMTAAICKLTQGAPLSVCSASPIGSVTSSIAGPVSTGLGVSAAPSSVPLNEAASGPFSRRFE